MPALREAVSPCPGSRAAARRPGAGDADEIIGGAGAPALAFRWLRGLPACDLPNAETGRSDSSKDGLCLRGIGDHPGDSIGLATTGRWTLIPHAPLYRRIDL